jgi:hypothetical protein
MTIFALVGCDGERLRVGLLVCECDLDRLERLLLLLLRVRPRDRERDPERRAPLRPSTGVIERERIVSSTLSAAGGACAGVGERPRDSLRRGGGEDIPFTSS